MTALFDLEMLLPPHLRADRDKDGKLPVRIIPVGDCELRIRTLEPGPYVHPSDRGIES